MIPQTAGVKQSLRASVPIYLRYSAFVFLLCLVALLTQFGGVPIYLPGCGKPIGIVRDNVFRKTIRSSRGHLLTRPPALGFDLSTLHDAQTAGALSVLVTDLDTETTYAAGITDVLRYGVRCVRGHGVQIALPLTHYSINGAPPQAAQTFADNAARLTAQPTLFEVTA